MLFTGWPISSEKCEEHNCDSVSCLEHRSNTGVKQVQRTPEEVT